MDKNSTNSSPSKLFTASILAIFLYLITPAFFLGFQKTYVNWMTILGQILGFLSLLVFSWVAISNLILRRIILTGALVLISLLSTLELGHFLLFKHRINEAGFFSILETTPDESLEFMGSYLKATHCLMLIGFHVGIWILGFSAAKIKFPRLNSVSKKKLLLISAGFFSLNFMTWTGSDSLNSTPSIGLIRLLIENRHFHAQALQWPLKLPQITSQISRPGPETLVVLIGESTNRKHLGIYGYYRNTTPSLAKIHDAIAFDQVLSPRSHTVPALRMALTLEKHERPAQRIENNFGILELAKAAGFQSYWLSNQAAVDWFGARVSFLYKNADQKFLRGSRLSAFYDEILFEDLDKILTDQSFQKKFIVIHLQGTHIAYRERYPSKFEVFKDTPQTDLKNLDHDELSIINDYDNAVGYQDFIISEIIQRLKLKEANSGLIYFSDHGQEVFDTQKFFGHSETRASAPMFEVPLITWFNSAGGFYDEIQKHTLLNRNQRYSTEDLIHSFHDFLGVKTAEYDSIKSIFSRKFRSREYQVGPQKNTPEN